MRVKRVNGLIIEKKVFEPKKNKFIRYCQNIYGQELSFQTFIQRSVSRLSYLKI